MLLLFVESYGAVTYETPAIADGLVESRADLRAAVAETDREVVTAYVDSPTFGASSWLAHLSLISGVEVRDQFAYTSLMASKRETMITNFARQGYRTVALMPGMRQAWPEGAFYHYDQIYGRDLLEYRGTGIRVVEHSGSVRPREDRRPRAKSSDAKAAVPRLSDEHDARALRAGRSVSTGLVENAGLRCVRQSGRRALRWPPFPTSRT